MAVPLSTLSAQGLRQNQAGVRTWQNMTSWSIHAHQPDLCYLQSAPGAADASRPGPPAARHWINVRDMTAEFQASLKVSAVGSTPNRVTRRGSIRLKRPHAAAEQRCDYRETGPAGVLRVNSR